MNLGEIIKKCRKEKGMTQEELAKKCGLSKNGLWNYENNRREPNIDTLKRIADTLEVPLELMISMSQISNITKEMHETINELKSKVNSENFNKEYVEEMLDNVMNDDIYFIKLIYKRLFFKNEIKLIDNMSQEVAKDIINNLKDTLEFELYKIKNNKK